MIRGDVEIRLPDVQTLSSREAVRAFFLKLGYNVERVVQTPEALGITSQDLVRHILHVERVADQDALLQVYLFEMRSLRVADRQALARTFREAGGDYLLILTTPDYSELDFVLLERVLPERPAEGITRRYATIRPRVLTVDRQNPGPRGDAGAAALRLHGKRPHRPA